MSGWIVTVGRDGVPRVARLTVDGMIEEVPDTSGMLAPVRHVSCGGVFDEADVTTRIARHVDCDVYLCPCCGRQMDNRPYGLSANGVVRLGRDGLPR